MHAIGPRVAAAGQFLRTRGLGGGVFAQGGERGVGLERPNWDRSGSAEAGFAAARRGARLRDVRGEACGRSRGAVGEIVVKIR